MRSSTHSRDFKSLIINAKICLNSSSRGPRQILPLLYTCARRPWGRELEYSKKPKRQHFSVIYQMVFKRYFLMFASFVIKTKSSEIA